MNNMAQSPTQPLKNKKAANDNESIPQIIIISRIDAIEMNAKARYLNFLIPDD